MGKRRWLEGILRETFRRFGYREIQTPTFESTDLFRAKSGPNVVNEIYTFKDKGDREICLRPELTAPVMRFYVGELSTEPKPLKLYYYGPCFRYEEPQEGRYREFYQFGLELLGPEGPSADAEVIAAAHEGLRAAGLKDFVLHVGHIGILRALMAAFEAPGNVKADLYRRIDKDDPDLRVALSDAGAPSELREAIAGVATHRRRVKTTDVPTVEAFFDDARRMVKPAATPEVETALAQLQETATLLAAYGVEDVELDLGVARGLDYYTGMVFELEAPKLGAQKQIGGGGAYSLAELFGGEHVGSAGFGLGFDRILLALEKEGAVPPLEPAADVYVAVLGNARAHALRLAQQVRAADVTADVDLMGRSLGKALQHASKIGARVAIIVGEKGLATGTVTLRDMKSGEQKDVPFDGAAEAASRILATP